MKSSEDFLPISILCHPDRILTSSLCSYADKAFEHSPLKLFGVVTKIITVDNHLIQLVLKDTSTHPDWRPTRLSYSSGSSAAIFAFSKSNHSYLDSVKDSYLEFKSWVRHSALSIVFIGLHSDPEVVTTSEGQVIAQELGVDYYEMAVDDLQTLDLVLRSLSRQVLEKSEANGEWEFRSDI